MPRGSFPLGNPFGGNPGFSGRGSAQMGGPGPADPTSSFDPGAINAALQPYGVQLPTSYQQPGMFENMGWGQRHPGLATGLDNALIAVAGMGPTGETAGENISNVARGVMGIGPYRRQYLSEQAMVPFQIAKEVGGLQAQQSYMQMQKAMAGYYGDRGQAALQANQQRLESAQIKAQMESGKELQVMTDASGKKFVGRPDYDMEKGTFNYVPTNIDVGEFEAERQRRGVAGIFGSDTNGHGTFLMSQMGKALGGMEKIPSDITKWGPKETDAYAQAVEKWGRLQPSYGLGLANLGEKRDTKADALDTQLFKNIQAGIKPQKPSKDDLDRAEMEAMVNTKGDQQAKLAAGSAARKQMEDAAQQKYQQDLLGVGQDFAEYHSDITNNRARFSNFQLWRDAKLGGVAPSTSTPPPKTTGTPSVSESISQLMGILNKPQ